MSRFSDFTDSVFPGVGSTIDRYMGGGGGGDGGSGDAAAAEEARKTALRRRIDMLYGIGDDAGAQAAQAQLEGEATKLGDATRAYYTDQLGRDYEKAERNNRFKLARTGQMGGSEQVFQQGELASDRDLGATRVDEAVRRAIASLKTSREQERLSSINLVNSGAGDSAVTAAQTGLRNSLDNVSNQSKAELFSDLFSVGADSLARSNAADQQAALAARYRDRLGAFFPPTSTSSGRVTAS